jgi:DNA-binding transcriptional MerR regulator
MSDVMPIGLLSRKTGVKIPTIRYYESVGLLRPPPRSEGNRRLY